MNNADELARSLEQSPGEWTAGPHRLRHEPTGIQLWISMGWMFMGAYESSTDLHLGIRGRWKLWRAYKRWKRGQVSDLFSSESPNSPTGGG